MKKICLSLFCFVVVVLVGAFLLSSRGSYQLPVSLNEISSVTLYRTGESAVPAYVKMEIDQAQEISVLVNTLNRLTAKGDFDALPAGGTTFFLAFHLTDGTQLLCTYDQTSSSGGFYTDGSLRAEVSHLDLQTLFAALGYDGLSFREEELAPFPSLT